MVKECQVSSLSPLSSLAKPTAFKSNPTAFNDKSPTLNDSYRPRQNQIKPRILSTRIIKMKKIILVSRHNKYTKIF